MNKDFIDFLSEAGIYSKMDISDDNVAELISLFCRDYSMDLFCLKCNSISVFRKMAISQRGSIDFEGFLSAIKLAKRDGKVFCDDKNYRFKQLQLEVSNTRLEFSCSRDNTYTISMFFVLTSKSLIKIGQYPSPIDISAKIPSKYSSMLNNYFKEYKNAIELNCHGYHVGAYAYLRRIIEQLIEQAHIKAAKQTDWDETEYNSKRMGEKVKSLEGFLPDFFVSNAKIYGLISKGIHELSEDECKNMFSVLKSTIEYILNETLEENEKELKKAEVSKAIALLAGKHSNK